MFKRTCQSPPMRKYLSTASGLTPASISFSEEDNGKNHLSVSWYANQASRNIGYKVLRDGRMYFSLLFRVNFFVALPAEGDALLEFIDVEKQTLG